jgi:DNA-binding MarR family transcriptional regulator
MDNPNVKLMSLYQAIELYRALDPDCPIQVISLFLLIATSPGRTISSYAQQTGMSLASVSRAAARLSSYGIGDKGKFDFVRYEENPENRREKYLFLTSKGERFIQGMAKVM